MQSIEDKILTSISKRGRGSVFFASDFTSFGEAKTIHKALQRLSDKAKIIRLARGIYYYPKIEKKLGLGVLYLSFEEIAQAIAKRDKARIVPTGQYAMNKLGLSTQMPMNIVYLTDGSPRKITINNGRGILFKHTAPKNLAFNNELFMFIVLALKEISQDNVTEEHINQIQKLLQNEDVNKIKSDFKLVPAWIRTIIMGAYE